MNDRKIKPPATEVPCPSGIFWIIEQGDTLWTITQQLGVSINDILKINPGINPDNLTIGLKICIPEATNKPAIVKKSNPIPTAYSRP